MVFPRAPVAADTNIAPYQDRPTVSFYSGRHKSKEGQDFRPTSTFECFVFVNVAPITLKEFPGFWLLIYTIVLCVTFQAADMNIMSHMLCILYTLVL